MEFDTQTPPWQNSDPNSFAYPSARERWPVIITQAIDDVHRSNWDVGDEQRAEGKKIIEALAKLKYELQHDRTMTPLPDDGLGDIDAYNGELEARGAPSWLKAPWLFSECYLYRRMHTIFSLSTHWKSYDIFYRSKLSGLRSSRPAILELAAQYRDAVSSKLPSVNVPSSNDKNPDEAVDAEALLFVETCEICLWGNKTDLSLLTSLSDEGIQALQGSEARKKSEAKILVNHLGRAFPILHDARKRGEAHRRVDVVLDNAGFELFVDLVLALYLLDAALATSVVLHPKSMPWFVSDVVPTDFLSLLEALRDPGEFFAGLAAGAGGVSLSEDEAASVKDLFTRLATYHENGQLILRPNGFWTEGGSFWRMPHTAPELFEDLKESLLVIFKGDLNYRKLVGDAMWDPTTPFASALGPLGQGSGLRILVLRTCKGDAIVGLPAGKDEELRKDEDGGISPARKWAWGGVWAVCQLSDGK